MSMRRDLTTTQDSWLTTKNFIFFTLFPYGTRYREKNTNFCKFLAQKFNKLADDTFLLGSENQGNMLSDGMVIFKVLSHPGIYFFVRK